MSEEDSERKEPRLRDIARRFLREGDDSDKRIDAREVLGAVLDSGDKAKTELVRMVGREVRTYLEALELHKDALHLLTHYSLDVNASFSLKPLADAVGARTARPPAEE